MMNLWYLFAGLAFAGAGIYKLVLNNFSIGITWIILGVLFILLAKSGHKRVDKDK